MGVCVDARRGCPFGRGGAAGVGPRCDRVTMGSRRFGGLRDAVSDVGDGLDCWRFSELASQSADRDLDGVGERVDVLVPYLGEEVLGAEDGVLGAHQGFEYRELFGGEVEPSSVAGGGVVQGVEFDPGRPEDSGLGCGPAAGESADAEHELGEMERLWEVVVGSEGEAADALRRGRRMR